MSDPRPEEARSGTNDRLPFVDPWVAASLLQKAIRRGQGELAEAAALRLYRLRGRGLWRRFLIIAFEDVGIGSVAALVQTTTLCTRADARVVFGGDECALRYIARLLADAPKDRSADHLIGAAASHPTFSEARSAFAVCTMMDQRDLVADADLPIPVRSMAAWRSSGMAFGLERARKRQDLSGLMSLMSIYARLGAPCDLVRASGEAAAQIFEPIVLMAPLIWLVAAEGPEPTIVDCSVPSAPIIAGVPLYAFDKHTAIGKTAIHRLAAENLAVQQVLFAFVEERKRNDVASMAAFYADAAPVAQRFEWSGSQKLEALGAEADMLRAGAPLAGVAPILGAVRDNLDHLNFLRAKFFSRQPR